MNKKVILAGSLIAAAILISLVIFMRFGSTEMKPNSPPSVSGGLPNMSIIEGRKHKERLNQDTERQ